MKLYIWNYLEGLTDNYHSGGGLVIVTDRDASEALDAYNGDTRDYSSKGTLRELPEADTTMEVVSDKEQVWVFPDAGCC